ncbi:MAG TPA: SpoIIIAH-like family protein [Clostridia bacterium]|nr:SpoIIIAH-like family protein [Clostridia bacterium]
MLSVTVRKSTVLRFMILVVVVAALAFYVGARREAFEKRSIMGEDMEASVPASGERLIVEGDSKTQNGVSEEAQGTSRTGAGASVKMSGALEDEGDGVFAEGTGKETQDGFFEESRMERERTYSRESEMLKSIAEDPDADQTVKSEALTRLMKLGREWTGAKMAEDLVRQLGYEDAFVSPTKDGAVVFVKAGALEKGDVARIADVVMRTLGLGPEGISVVPKPEG